MSDETKGATVMVQGCRHDNVDDHNQALLAAPCPDCASLIDMPTWRNLHPPPEPPKSWVRQKAEETAPQNGDNVAAWRERMLRETVEERCRVLKVDGRHGGAEFLRRAMLEPKA